MFPVHPRTRGRLERLIGTMPAMVNLRLVDPLPHLDFVQLMTHARCVLTDSGGIQEETTALGVPCLTLRENTERLITVSRGANRVIGVEPHAIYTHWHRAADGQWPTGELPELWDGHAARRIVTILLSDTLSPQGRGQGEGGGPAWTPGS